MNSKITNEFLEIASTLMSRGTQLRPAATESEIERLSRKIGAEISDEARALYSTFNGFELLIPDDQSMVCLWSIDNIIEAIGDERSFDNRQVIGDYFLSSSEFRCDLTQSPSAVLLDEGGYVVANSLLEFCRKISTGRVV